MQEMSSSMPTPTNRMSYCSPRDVTAIGGMAQKRGNVISNTWESPSSIRGKTSHTPPTICGRTSLAYVETPRIIRGETTHQDKEISKDRKNTDSILGHGPEITESMDFCFAKTSDGLGIPEPDRTAEEEKTWPGSQRNVRAVPPRQPCGPLRVMTRRSHRRVPSRTLTTGRASGRCDAAILCGPANRPAVWRRAGRRRQLG